MNLIETELLSQEEDQQEEQKLDPGRFTHPPEEQESQPQPSQTLGFQETQQPLLPVIATTEEVKIAPKSNELIWKTTQEETFNIH